MNSIFFDLCWILGGTLTALVLYKGCHAGWFTVKPRVRIDPEWRVDEERERLKAAAIWKGYRRS